MDELRELTVAARALGPDAWIDALAEMDRAVAGLTAARAAVLMKAKASVSWHRGGYASFEAWLGAVSTVGTGKARSQVRVAGVLEDQPHVAGAVTSGQVSLTHAEVIARVSDRATRTPKGDLSPSEQETLLKLAKSNSADQFDKAAQRLMASRDRLGHDASHQEMRRRRFFTLSSTPAGTHVKGFLDPVAGHTLKLALEAATSRPGKNDDRSFEQRQADALVDVASLSLNSGEFKPGAQVRPHVSVIMSQETFADARAELSRRQTAQNGRNDQGGAAVEMDGAAIDSGHAVAAPATFEEGTPVPPSELTRILCDAQLTRIVVDAKTVALNLGRTTRLFSGELRRAVIARDGSCRFLSCERPARWCEVHHIQWWEEDLGSTSLENGILLCSFHHHEVHRGNLTVLPDARPIAVPTSSLGAASVGATSVGTASVEATSVRAGAVEAGSFRTPSARAASMRPGSAPFGKAPPGNSPPGNSPPVRSQRTDPGPGPGSSGPGHAGESSSPTGSSPPTEAVPPG